MSRHLPQDATEAKLRVLGGDFWQQAEQLCRNVAPQDLAHLPLYLLRHSRMTADLGGNYHYAFTMTRADLLYRDQIDPWLGRGPCIVVNDIGLAEDFEACDLRYVTLNLVLHELAHVLDKGDQYSEEHGESPEKIQFDRLVIDKSTTRPGRSELPRYFGHEASFIRIALHLVHRASVAGFDTKPTGIVHSQRYGLSLMSHYADALDDEPQRLATLTFREIRGIEPPETFQRLWQADLNQYHRRFPTHSGVST